jgi:two-component system chemotaxis sensor kinase CheA
MDMMEEFKQKFIEEADELITNLESSLLVLEKNPHEKEHIEQVFRVMHTLKGNGGMFGFNKISEFTHDLESIYDLVRTGRMEISRELLDTTLQSVDHLKVLLRDGDDLDSDTLKIHKTYTGKIGQIISKKLKSPGESQEINQKATPNVLSGQTDATQKITSTYYISFRPNPYIFNNGTNPLYLIDEIHGLGTTSVIAHSDNVPDLVSFEFSRCYTWWEIFVSTEEDKSTIADVFIFVEDDSNIDIQRISESNLFEENILTDYLEKLRSCNGIVDLKELHNLINAHEFEQLDQIPQLPEMVGDKEIPVANVLPAEEMIPPEVSQPKNKAETTISSIRVSSDKVDTLMNLVSEMVTVQARMSLLAEKSTNPEFVNIAENLHKLSKQLRDNAFSISLIPIGSILTRFQRLVRDLSNDLKKKVNFIIEGEETELDKNIIERLSDPLMHIIRNSLDHGIELPEIRVKEGKQEEATLHFKAYHSGSNVHVEIIDDGAGINTARVLEKARQQGLISDSDHLTDKQIYSLIFTPGFSTAKAVSDVSGRGVGLDVVNQKIRELRGEILIHSEKGKGTSITLVLPLTLSIIDGIQVKIQNTFYIIPLSAVHKIYSVNHSVIENTFDNVIVLEGEQIPYFYLRKQFELPGEPPQREEVLVVKYENQKVGLVIDKVMGEYQTVLKPLGKHYKHQEFISGGTILGDGTIALVLDTNKIIFQFANKNLIMEENL